MPFLFLFTLLSIIHAKDMILKPALVIHMQQKKENDNIMNYDTVRLDDENNAIIIIDQTKLPEDRFQMPLQLRLPEHLLP